MLHLTPISALLIWIAPCLLLAVQPAAHANPTETRIFSIKDDHDEFIFIGKCHDGRPYRLYSYQNSVNGLSLPFYDYEGPVGKGTVKTQAQPRVMAVRICRELAEVADDPNLD